MPNPPLLTGSCACGSIKYTSTALPDRITHCHCSTCREASGAGFLSFGLLQSSDLAWRFPADRPDLDFLLRRSQVAVRGSCPSCGTQLFMKYYCTPAETDVTMGSVREVRGPLPKPRSHIFVGEKAGWVELPDDGLRRYERFPEGFDGEIERWKARGGREEGDFLRAKL